LFYSTKWPCVSEFQAIILANIFCSLCTLYIWSVTTSMIYLLQNSLQTINFQVSNLEWIRFLIYTACLGHHNNRTSISLTMAEKPWSRIKVTISCGRMFSKLLVQPRRYNVLVKYQEAGRATLQMSLLELLPAPTGEVSVIVLHSCSPNPRSLKIHRDSQHL